MRKIIPITMSLLVLILLIGGVAGNASAATEYDVTVKNRNSHAITLSFVGLKVYQFDLPPGNTTLQLERGTYTSSYYGCGQLNFEQITVKPKDNVLDLDCDAPYDPSVDANDPSLKLLFVQNHTGQKIDFLLVGLDNNTDYWFSLVPGSNQLYVKPGTYQFSYFACSTFHRGNITVNQYRGADMDLSTCLTSANGAPITPNMAEFKVKNNTNGVLVIQLQGQYDYLFTVNGASAILTAEKGFYNYTLYGCQKTFTGVLMVGPDDAMIKTPVCTSSSQ